jgi:hypothetical protein
MGNALPLGSAKIWPVKLLDHQKIPFARDAHVVFATSLMTIRILVNG